jgi:hypothetical protein
MIQWMLEKTKIVKSVGNWPICDRWVFGSTTIKIDFEKNYVKLILFKSRLNVNFFLKKVKCKVIYIWIHEFKNKLNNKFEFYTKKINKFESKNYGVKNH